MSIEQTEATVGGDHAQGSFTVCSAPLPCAKLLVVGVSAPQGPAPLLEFPL